MIWTIGFDQFADSVGNKSGDGDKCLTQAQRHMHTADHTIGRKNRNNAKVPITVLTNNIAVQKINHNGIHGIIGQHNSFWQTGGAPGVGDGDCRIAHIRNLLGYGFFAGIHKSSPLDELIAVGNVGLGDQCLGNSLDKRQRSCSRLSDDQFLSDIVHDCLDLGECNIYDNKNFGAGIYNHSLNAMNIHARINGIGNRADFIQRIDSSDGFRQLAGQKGDNIAGFHTLCCESICDRINCMEQFPESDAFAIII